MLVARNMAVNTSQLDGRLAEHILPGKYVYIINWLASGIVIVGVAGVS